MKPPAFARVKVRLQMVQHAQQHSVSAAALAFRTTRPTVSKWLQRYLADGIHGLAEHSRRPHHSPQALDTARQERVIALRKEFGFISMPRLQRMGLLPCAPNTAYKYLQQAGLARRGQRHKHETKKSLREVKDKMAIGETIVVDTKHLKDLPHFYRYMQYHHLPRYQYTARDIKSGLLFTAYARQISLAHTRVFIQTIVAFLKENGLQPRQLGFQYDNGSEFIGSVRRGDYGALESWLQEQGIDFMRIPIRRWSYNADVETVHSIMEYEFFEIEEFPSCKNFYHKAAEYCLFFNNLRANSYRSGRAPIDYVHAAGRSPNICLWMPFDLDEALHREVKITAAKQRTQTQAIGVDYLKTLCNTVRTLPGYDVSEKPSCRPCGRWAAT